LLVIMEVPQLFISISLHAISHKGATSYLNSEDVFIETFV